MFGYGLTFPDVYRGGFPSEVYITSWFPDSDSNPNWTYKVSFSADTGQTFRHVYVSDVYSPYEKSRPAFISDIEPGVFYIIRRYEMEDTDPLGWHVKLCVDHYKDYGETLVDTYCHDLTKDYVTDIGEMEMKDDVVVYPNPTNGEVRVTSNRLQVTGVELFDIFLRLQKAESRKQKAEWRMDISNVSAGMYFLRIKTDSGIINRKIVKY